MSAIRPIKPKPSLSRPISGLKPRRIRPEAVPVTAQPETVPAEFAGGWIARSFDGLRILGHGPTIADARASAGGAPGLRFAKLPSLDALRGVMRPDR